ETTTKIAPNARACTNAVSLPARNVAAALAQASHDFGLIHWNAAAPKNPTPRAPLPVLCAPAVAIFHASHNNTAAPHHFSAVSTIGLLSTTVPNPKPTTNTITPMPTATPNSAGRPRQTPTWAPVAVSNVLLGPGVPA